MNGSPGSSGLPVAVDGNLVPQRPAGLDPLVDGGDAARPRDPPQVTSRSFIAQPPLRGASADWRRTRSRPAHGLGEPGFESRPRLPAQDRSCPANVGAHGALLARPGGGADRSCSRQADGRTRRWRTGELVDRQGPPAAEVEDAAVAADSAAPEPSRPRCRRCRRSRASARRRRRS